MHTVPNAAGEGSSHLHLDQFEAEDADWYIQQYALDRGLDPHEALRAVRSWQAERRVYLDRQGLFWAEPPKQAPMPEQGSSPPMRAPAPLDWPPGFAGEIAQFVYGAAPRPVKEVAIVAALGLLAGICGRQWQIPQSGLNLYVLLVARSAIGKEAMHSGVSAILKAVSKKTPSAHQFFDFNEYASGPALIKGCVDRRSFVNVLGEIGHLLKTMSKAKAGDAAFTLRSQWTKLYTKSAASAIAAGISYSSTDNNVASIESLSYSLIGESTPGKFLASLTPDMMEDGFMSRLTVIEYDGQRPEKNPAPLETPPDALVTKLANLADYADLQAAKDQCVRLGRTLEVATYLEAFEAECDKRINGTDDESRRQMWNRAHLKALRIAALLAVADNHIAPLITLAHAEWAVNLVRRDIAAFTKRLDSGDVGDSDDARERKLVMLVKEYLTKPVPESYKVPDAMRQNGIVGRNYLLMRVRNVEVFYGHPQKANKALDETIASMLASGYFMECQKDKVIDAYSYHGKAYRVLKLPDYGTN